MSFILPGGLGQLMAPPSTISAWDPAHQWSINGGTAVLSNGNKTWTATGTGTGTSTATIRGFKSNNSGRLYFEVVVGTLAMSGMESAGVVTSSFVAAVGTNVGIIGNDANSWGFVNQAVSQWVAYNNGASNAATATTGGASGDVLGFHIDFTGGYIYFSRNGTFYPGNPGNTANAGFTFTAGTTLFTACSVDNYQSINSAMTLKTITPFSYAPYTGYSQWG